MSEDDQKRTHAHNQPDTDEFQDKQSSGMGDDTIHRIHQQLQREKDEPTEAFSPIPVYLLVIIGGLMFWGGFYMSNYSADFRADIYNPEYVPGAMNQTEVAFDPLKKGERLYKNNCAACHQANGEGVAGAFPPLAGSPWVVGSEARLVKILLRGLQGPIVVMGNEYNGNMPSYGENGLGWSDRDIGAVATYVRQAWGNGAPAVPEETVAAVRTEIAAKSGAWSATELLDAHPME